MAAAPGIITDVSALAVPAEPLVLLAPVPLPSALGLVPVADVPDDDEASVPPVPGALVLVLEPEPLVSLLLLEDEVPPVPDGLVVPELVVVPLSLLDDEVPPVPPELVVP